MKIHDRLNPRLAALGAATVLAIAGAACGSDDDGGSKSAAAKSGKETPTGAVPATGDERQIEATYKSLLDALYAGDGKKACSLMTPKTQKGFGKASKTTCAKRVEQESETLSKLRPKVISFRVQGTRAVIRAGSANTFKYPVPFAKVDGKWKVDGGF
jgi:hypothetical protein